MYLHKGGAIRIQVQKWGNSFAIRIPKSFAAEVGIAQDSQIKLSLQDGKLVLVPVSSPPLTLHTLLGAITDDNLHSEVSTGDMVGSESW